MFIFTLVKPLILNKQWDWAIKILLMSVSQKNTRRYVPVVWIFSQKAYILSVCLVDNNIFSDDLMCPKRLLTWSRYCDQKRVREEAATNQLKSTLLENKCLLLLNRLLLVWNYWKRYMGSKNQQKWVRTPDQMIDAELITNCTGINWIYNQCVRDEASQRQHPCLTLSN